MSKEDKAKRDRRNAETPPFTFRFANRRIKAAVERLAKKNHRTVAGELNAIIEDAAAASAEGAK